MSRTILPRTRRVRAGAVAAVLVVGVLAACNSTEVEGATLVIVAADRKVPITVRCKASETCVGTVAVRIGAIDSPAVPFAIPAGTATAIVATLTTAQNAALPATGVVAAEARIDESAPSDKDPRSEALGLRRPTASTSRVSVSTSGAESDGAIYEPTISSDGRYVAFRAQATTLVAGTDGRGHQVYVHDRVTGSTTVASVNSGEVLGDSVASRPAISGDGRYVAFQTGSQNMGLPGGATDIFVRDRTKGETVQVSVAMDGEEPDGHSTLPSISADGRYVAFVSTASDLVPVDTNSRADVFLLDRTTGTTQMVSVSSDEVQISAASSPPVVSDDGRYVAFRTTAAGLVPGDTNNAQDVFLRDTIAGTTTRVSVGADGSQATNGSYDPAISADGCHVAFETLSKLVPEDTDSRHDVYVWDCTLGRTIRVPGGATSAPNALSISGDGRFVALGSNLPLVPEDTNTWRDVFVHDRTAATTTRVSVATDGTQTPYGHTSSTPVISRDGRSVAFLSSAANLVAGDTNGYSDLFVRDLG